MERFFAILTQRVHRLEATRNDYAGDGTMAVFGTPETTASCSRCPDLCEDLSFVVHTARKPALSGVRADRTPSSYAASRHTWIGATRAE
jgi:class 3 adenylate cyclase